MRRRRFLQLLVTAIGGGMAGDELERAWELLDRGRARPDSAFLAGLQDTTRRLLVRSREARPALLATPIQDHLAGLRGLLRSSVPEGLRTRLLSTTAETAMLAAHNAFLLGMPGLAQRRLELGLALSREAGDPALQGAFLSREAEFTHSSRYGLAGDDRRALQLLDQAAGLAGPRAEPVLLAGILASRGEQHAAVGDVEGCLRDLERAQELLQARGPSRPGVLPISNLTELAAVRGSAEVRLAAVAPAQARAAAATLARVAAEMPAEHGPWRATVLADRGAAHALQGEAEEAASTLAEALELTESVGARHNVPRIARYHRRHLGGVDLPAVRELGDRLRAAGVPH
jgi:tetratricopeptide (TPR) repeat protein